MKPYFPRSLIKSVNLLGARVVILNCLADHALYVLEQAQRLGMLEAGWVWLVTDGVTGFVCVTLMHTV